MSLTVQVAPELLSLAKAVGLVGPDGEVEGEWFAHPLDALRAILSDSHQRTALLSLLDMAVPAAADPAGGEGRWHPLLDAAGRGNVYLTVDGSVIGVAATIQTPPMATAAKASLRVPLLDVSSPAPVAIAGSAGAPVELELEASWPAGAHPSRVAVVVSVDAAGGGSLRVVMEDLDPAAPPGTRTELDPAALDADAARALATLLVEGLGEATGADPVVDRVISNLPGVLGLADALPQLPLHELTSDPAALRNWLSAIVADPATFERWFTHLAGLLGSGLPAAEPTISGTGTVADPFRATLLPLADGSFSLTLAADRPASGPGTLVPGISVVLTASEARVEASASILGIPLGGTAPVIVLPSAHLSLLAPTVGVVVDAAPDVKVGAVAGGVAWDGTRLVPRLELHDAVLAGTAYPFLDLTNANAIVATASAALESAIVSAIGGSRTGEAVLALLGLGAPASDSAWPHQLDLTALVESPTRAIAAVHRTALGDPQHGWDHLFGELAALFGTDGPVLGAGRPEDPWRVTLAGEGLVGLELAAWNAADSDTPAGTQLLRMGLRASFANSPWAGAWQTEVLAFELPSSGPAALRFLGSQHLSLTLEPTVTLTTTAGLELTATSISVQCEWAPGSSPAWAVLLEDLAVTGSGDTVGPATIEVSPASFDPAAPDLGLGIGAEAATALLRFLFTEALHSWAGPAGVTLGALVGLHRGLRGLPPDWPLLTPADPADLGTLLSDPIGRLAAQLERVAGESSVDGTPFLLAALPWIRALLAGELPAIPAASYPPALPFSGAGTHDRPWALPLADDTLELIGWLEPDGPPAAWWLGLAEQIRDAADGAALVSLLDAAAGLLPEVDAALDRRDAAQASAALDALAAWLKLGDGIVPFAAQTPAGPTWAKGTPLSAAHPDLPEDPAAISQIQSAIDAWAGGPITTAPRAVVLLAPGFLDHHAWTAYLQAAEPRRPEGAHFDLRAPGIDPLTEPLNSVSAIATHYTADLLDADLAPMAAQLGRVVDRVKDLTGRAEVYLVAHSTAGLVAWLYGAAEPDSVAGVVTLGTPFGGSALTPLFDSQVAGAVRLVNTLLPASERTPQGRAIAHLAATLDGSMPYLPSHFVGVVGVVDTVQGLAIPSRLSASLIEETAAAVADRLVAAVDGLAPPTHFAFGARARFKIHEGVGALAAETTVRVDARQVNLGGSVGPAARPAPAVEVLTAVTRADGVWLIGGPEAPAGARVRWAELGASIVPGASGGATALPVLRLHDTGADPIRPWVDLDDLLARLPSLPPLAPLSRDTPAPGTPEAFLLDGLSALGLLIPDGVGGLALSLQELGAVAAEPIARLGPRVPALVDVLTNAIGASRGEGQSWTLELAAAPLALTLLGEPWLIRVRTHDPDTGADTFEIDPSLSVVFEAELSLPDFGSSSAASLQLAGAHLSWASATGAVTLAAPPWLEPIQLSPPPPPEVLRGALTDPLPLVVASAALSGAFASLAGENLRVRGMERLLTSPGEWFLAPDGLGAADGSGFDMARVGALLEEIASSLGLGGAGGIQFPGGLEVVTTGPDPLTVALHGTVPLGDAGDELEVSLELQINGSLTVTPGGSGSLRLALPNSGWSGIEIGFGADPRGIALSVAPTNGDPIELLPNFSGFGSLAGSAASLLAALLQAMVDELAPQPDQSTGLLRSALEVATGLGIYDFDAAGFTDPARAEELGRMLEPGWLESKSGNAPAIVGEVAGMFAEPSPPVDLPGAVTANVGTVRWELPLGVGGTLVVTVGWTGPGGSETLALVIESHDAELGPVFVESLRIGFDQGLVLSLDLQLQSGGELAFLEPAVALAEVNGTPTLELYPLGTSAQADLSLRLTPDPQLVHAPGGPLALLEAWALPLSARMLLREFEGNLDQDLWSEGPTSRVVLEDCGVVQPGSGSPVLAMPLPSSPELALRALRALMNGTLIEVTPTLSLIIQASDGRRGVQLKGSQELGGGSVDVSLRFGDADWLDDPEAGVTFWLLEDVTVEPWVRLMPSLTFEGLGAVLSKPTGEPLLEGPFEIGSASGYLFLDAAFLDQALDPALEVSALGAAAELLDAAVKLSSEDGDSFLQEILPAELAATFDFGVLWREAEGLTFLGGTAGDGLELTFPLSLDLGVISLLELILGLETEGSTSILRAGLSGAVTLGPVRGVVENVGVQAEFAPGGTELGFRAPDGLGLSIDADVVTGGGYLYHDPDAAEYAGAVQLEALGFGLAATGILLTELDGGDWSLIVTISVTFTGVQLGFGFTLDGVGGVLGVHRSFATAVLQAGLKDGSLDAVLYPDDPIGDAPAILATLADAFPPVLDQYVFGPTVKIGWSGMLSAELGVIFEIPDPVKVALLGQLEIGMPFLGSPLVELHMDTLGVLDLGAGELAIDSSLYDSNVVGYSLEGDLAIRLNWLSQPSFTLAVGGFHPAYPAPPGFPTLRRMSISLDTGGNPLMRLDGYFALTSNSVQFGAHFDFFMDLVAYTIEAWAGFDVLFTFTPFQMRVDLELGATVSAVGVTLWGVDLAVAVSGPKPWEICGTASFKLLGIETEFNLDLTLPPYGEPEEIEAVDAADLVLDSLSNQQNWAPALPDGEVSGVVFAPAYEVGDGLLVHPGGRVEIRQRAVPLGEDVELVGTAEVEGANHFLITAVEIVQGDGTAMPLPAGDWSSLDDWFAPGQFFEMSDAAKLEGPSFEMMQAGIVLGPSGVAAGAEVDAPFEYETGIIDPTVEAAFPQSVPPVLGRFQLPDADQLVLASVGSKALAGNGEAASAPLVAMSPQVWTAASTDDLSLVSLSTTSTSRAGLAAAAARQGERGAVQVVPTHELQGEGTSP